MTLRPSLGSCGINRSRSSSSSATTLASATVLLVAAELALGADGVGRQLPGDGQVLVGRRAARASCARRSRALCGGATDHAARFDPARELGRRGGRGPGSTRPQAPQGDRAQLKASAAREGADRTGPRACYSSSVVFLVAIVVGLLFGAGDQYLGSIDARSLWTVSASLLSAPWLVFPFLFGCSQLRAGRAIKVGLVATVAALSGYFLMIMLPFEGGQWSFNLPEIHGLLRATGRTSSEAS